MKDNHNENNYLPQQGELKKSLVFAPNSTQIPNSICDYWLRKLTPAEFKVLICIYRKCFEWNHTRTTIALREIEEMTGLSKRGIITNLKSLINYGLINKRKENHANESVCYEVVYFVEGSLENIF